MLARSLPSLSVVIATALATSHAANAACTIDRARPATTLPTSASGQTFSFVATNDCTMLMFSASRGALTKTPTMGAVAGIGAHWYDVVLSPMEWQSISGPSVTTLRWTVMGTDMATGATVRVNTTNELDQDRDGWTRTEGDAGRCDRTANVNPGATEICGNAVDEDCDGQIDECVALSLGNADAVVEGSMTESHLGSTLAIADVNGDGIADLLNGAPGDRDTNHGGQVYVSFGPLAGTVVAGDGPTITPERARDRIGDSLAGGDADGDGFDDVLAGEWDHSGFAELMYGPITADVSTSMADLEITDPREIERFAFHMQIATDIDGDGENDLVISAPFGAIDDGAVYVVPGSTTGSVEVESVDTYMFRGPSGGDSSYLGVSTTDLGDTDGDGTAELAMYSLEAAYVVPGGLASGNYDVSTVAAATIDLTGRTWYSGADGANLAGLDYNDDGYRDLLVGDPYGGSGDTGGAVYLFEGPLSGDIDAETDATVTWQGRGVGYLVATGDCSGDGEADYLFAGLNNVYLGLGPVMSGVVEVDTLASFPAAELIGAAAVDGALLFAPDWSGDGVQEIVVGVNNATTDAGGTNAGAAYVFYSDMF